MQIPKDKILELIRFQGDPRQTRLAEAELPEKVHPVRDQGLLARFGIAPADLAGDFGDPFAR